jgi:hypothetical protein
MGFATAMFRSREGTPWVRSNRRLRRVKISADGTGVVSHAGVGLLREPAEGTGLVEAVSDALVDT